MGTFAGLDVSLKETSVCILDQDGTRVFEGKVESEPAAIVWLIRKRAPDLARVGLESGSTSVWLTHAKLLNVGNPSVVSANLANLDHGERKEKSSHLTDGKDLITRRAEMP